MFNKSILCAAVAVLAFSAGSAFAEISPDDVKRLQADLTPLGAERAGNADGTIPEWTGGLSGAFPGWPNKDNHRPNPHADDKAQFTITAANMDQYAAKLPEAAKAMFKAYPDTFKMNVYPTRRTAAYPQTFYDAIARDAVTAKLTRGGDAVEGVWGAVPFPIPTNGHEVIWNHLLRYTGVYREASVGENLVYTNGSNLQYDFKLDIHHTFHDPNVSEKDRKGGVLWKYSSTMSKPARDAGEGILAMDNINFADNPRKAWIYDPGERRVRRAPNMGFDTPDRALNVFDDYELYSGSPERYDFKLIGKKEMYIPYNNNEVNSPRHDVSTALTPGFINADLLRYELHRVWVVEATVKNGHRHVYAKRRFYVDEDTWNIMVTDKYDGNGNLWRVGFSYPVVAAEMPLTGGGSYVHVDLKKNGYYLAFTSLGKGRKGTDFSQTPPKASYYTAGALRRRGR
ncbi:DUF1329 domain-containing protein [Marinobacterium jannaschii]|uniref:DUF1329 domain-containing protein n=1 Tax=Marinobacterium jannaschii TaxID=64970 RepID=UPI0004801B99|nr:DUF1329 domain-containing protein [Marinobacterium jannaschii]